MTNATHFAIIQMMKTWMEYTICTLLAIIAMAISQANACSPHKDPYKARIAIQASGDLTSKFNNVLVENVIIEDSSFNQALAILNDSAYSISETNEKTAPDLLPIIVKHRTAPFAIGHVVEIFPNTDTTFLGYHKHDSIDIMESSYLNAVDSICMAYGYEWSIEIVYYSPCLVFYKSI